MSSLKDIGGTFIKKLPEEEKWYQERLKACLSCKFNTANVDTDKLNFAEKLLFAVKDKEVLCPKGSCMICGCCVDRKSSLKTEACALTKVQNQEKYKGELPRWNALEVKNLDGDLKFELLPNSDGEFTAHQKEILFTNTVYKPVLKYNFMVTKSSRFDYRSSTVSCNCTSIQAVKVKGNDKQMIFNVEISTVNFSFPVNERMLTINYLVKNNVQKQLPIKFKITKYEQ